MEMVVNTFQMISSNRIANAELTPSTLTPHSAEFAVASNIASRILNTEYGIWNIRNGFVLNGA